MQSTPPVTGRTPWDFLTELLHLLYRIGPATIVVGGFLILAFLFYQEVNKARLEADAQLQERLVTAQKELIQTYQKIGGMSDQLITNIHGLLKLNTKIDNEIEESRSRYDRLHEREQANLENARDQAMKAKEQADQARAKAEEARIEARQARAEADQAKEDAKEAIAEQQATNRYLADLDDRRKSLQVEIKTYERDKERLETALAELGDRLASQREDSQSSGASQEDPDQAVREVLRGFAENPTDYDDDKFQTLVGSQISAFEEIVKADFASFLWLTDEDGTFFGFFEEIDYGYGHILAVSSFGGDAIVTVDTFAIFVIELPRAENWYRNWLGWLSLSTRNGEEVYATYFSETVEKWNIQQLASWEEVDLTVVTGEPSEFDVVSFSEFKRDYPVPFENWSGQMDEFGRPALILRMSERAEGYNAESAAWVDKSALPEQLKGAFKSILVGAVTGGHNAIADHLGPEIEQDELGILAAMALRDNPQIEFEEDVGEEDVNSVHTWKFTVSVGATETKVPRQTFEISFQQNQDEQPPTWNLASINVNPTQVPEPRNN